MLLAVGLLCALYLADLAGMGMVQPDEPRYADVGRAMARSGDWITPRLWGQPWFEKPALLYWMTAAGFRLGLGPDLAPRLPVAILSVLFMSFFWWRLKLDWDQRAASYATAMLATSAGWLTYSHVAVTDLPLAAFFSAAVLLSLSWIARGQRDNLPAAAACLGLAALAKGLVPLVLFLPVLAIGWKRLRDWFRPGPLLAFSACALPWYILCTIRNGSAFLKVFFLQQQFERFRSQTLQHVQPPWFYVPIFLVLLYPWFPLIVFPSVVFPEGVRQDLRVRTLAAVVVFGFVFFSASVNKLPGYLIPLMPSAFALLGLGLSRSRHSAVAVVAPILLLGALPSISEIAPHVLASHGLGRRRRTIVSGRRLAVRGWHSRVHSRPVRAQTGVWNCRDAGWPRIPVVSVRHLPSIRCSRLGPPTLARRSAAMRAGCFARPALWAVLLRGKQISACPSVVH